MGLLSLEQLVVLEKRVDLARLSLNLLANYYEKYLMKHTYRFELENGVLMDLKFSKKDFCHLTGVQQLVRNRQQADINKRGKTSINGFMYSGNEGFRRIKKNKFDFSHLKGMHSTYYKNKFEKEEKCNFFHLIHRLLESDNVKVVDFVGLSDSDVTCEFIFHDEYDNALLHLGVEKDSDKNHFFPRTFFVRYLNKADPDKFTKGRTLIEIKSKTIIES